MSFDNFSGIGFISESDSPDADFFQIHGTAIGSGDQTRGHLSGEKKMWPAEVLEPAASTLEGKKIVVNHENKDAYKVVGEVTDAMFQEGRGVIYQGLIDDSELARKIGLGWLEVSPRIIHSQKGEERNDIFIPDEIFQFDNLSIVNRGASHSNTVDLGEHDEMMAEELQESFDSQPEMESAEFQRRVDENQIDFSDWLYETPEGAQGATQSFPCEGIHEHDVDGETFYAPCSSHEQFLRSLSERDTEEMQISEARMPEYSGTETASWGDIPADTLSYYVDNLDLSGETWDDLTDDERSEVAQHTLLGDPDADTADGGIFFPVVNAANSNLNRGALEAVRSGRGQQADIPESVYESAFSMAGRLLNEEFDTDVETDIEEMTKHDNTEMKQLASQISSHTQLTRSESMNLVTTIRPDMQMVDSDVLAKVVSQAIGAKEEDMRQIISRMETHKEDMTELEEFADKIVELEQFEDIDSESVVSTLEELAEDSEETDDSQHGSPDVENLERILGDD